MAPVFSSSAVTQPRTPISPPLLPTRIFPLTITGAMVIVSPLLISPSFVCQSSLPLPASIATVWLSSVLRKTLPLSKASPRLTTSQQATPAAEGSGFGAYDHFSSPVVASSANTRLGYGPAYGPTTYIVPSTTRGAASCPRSAPTENVQASCRREALPALI